MFTKTFWIMWANDEAHSPPEPIKAKSPRDAADKFISGWPDFDGQMWVFTAEPAWTVTGHSTRGAIMVHDAANTRKRFSLRRR